MHKSLKHNNAMRGENIYTLKKGERILIKTSAKHTVFKGGFYGFFVSEIHCSASLGNVVVFRSENECISAQIIKKRFGFIIDKWNIFVGIRKHCARPYAVRLGKQGFFNLRRFFASHTLCKIFYFIGKCRFVLNNYFGRR